VEEKEFTNAVNEFTGAEVIGNATDPKLLSAGFYFDAGAACERKGDFEEAEKYFDKSLELSPNFAAALNYLGYMLADRGVELEKARGLIEKAVKMEPKSAAYMDSLGWVLYRLKKPQEALARIQEAIKLSEQVDATIYDHLGDIYAELKQPDKAVEAWRKSLSVEPNEEIKKKVERSAAKDIPTY
jgi:tetratricopeptide (TPR) repeat protein